MTQALRLGIDIGGTNTAIGIVNEQSHIIWSSNIPSKGYENVHAFIEAIYHVVKNNINQEEFEQIYSIGVGAPNGNYYTGNIEFAPNLEWKGVIPLAKMLESLFAKKVVVSNDANAAAMGELLYGAAKGMKDFIVVTLGTGVGSGFVANGKLIYGHDGFAGELGHVIAVREGRQCGCGRKGCLEAYTSATGIVITAKEMQLNYQGVTILKNKISSAKDIYDAAVLNDYLALKIFDYTGKLLGQTLADTVAITSPEAIILFGGLAKAGDYILLPTQKYFEQNLLSIYQNKVKILLSTLPEANAAILGAAALCD
jgi:glucokinase